MKVRVTKASDWEWSIEKEFNSVEDLFNFVKTCGKELIIGYNYNPKSGIYDMPTVTIYDDYVE